MLTKTAFRHTSRRTLAGKSRCKSLRGRNSLRLQLERLEPRQLLSVNPAITEIMANNNSHATAAAELEVGLIDLTDQVCFADTCPAVIDDVLVWRDTHHLTATYARLLGDAFAAQLHHFMPDLFRLDTASE